MDVFAKAWVNGMVQGVGFRYFILRLANSYGLKGIVKNLPDGRVYIEVEGDKGVIQSFLKDVRVGSRWADVKHVDVEWDEYKGQYSRFDVSF